jgi:molecular chaperone DnaK (HSP70)
MAKKNLFIHQIQQIRVGDSTNIPTALYYRDSAGPLVGNEALDATDDVLAINQDFKVDLGRHDSARSRQNQRFLTGSGEEKSAYVMTQDFFTHVLRQTSRWLGEHQVEEAAHMLIAEPLAMHAESDSRWLENYRRNIGEMLRNRTSQDYPNIRFEEVSFLPEPFAVFQYYRYGINHQLLAGAVKHQALILDFGGGTFDVCVIETTKGGDISESGRNAKPYGASSQPVGGFQINRTLAEHLLRQHVVGGRRDQFKQGLKVYDDWRHNEKDLSTVREDLQNFAQNFHRMSLELESSKVALCKQIRNWDLEAPLSEQTRVRLPTDPFLKTSPSRSVPLSATELRDVFLKEIWQKRLQPTVRETLI